MTTQLLQEILPLTLKTPKNESALVQNEDAYAFMIGHILGIAHLSNKGYMQVDQASQNLASWLHKLLKSYGMLPKGSTVNYTLRWDKRNDPPTCTESHKFCTRTYVLGNWLDTFYEKKPGAKHKNKKVPLNINELLVMPLSLAIWFLGDGWFDGDNVCFAAGDCDGASCQRLQRCLELNLGFKTTLVQLDPSKNNGRTAHRITLSVVSYVKFKQLVQPYLNDLEAFMGGPGSLKKDEFLKRKILP
jgi:hypothetical protein